MATVEDTPDTADAPDAKEKPAKPVKAKSKAKPKDKGGKAKKGKGGKGKKGKGGAGSSSLSIAGHPRAAAAVKRAKGFGGVGGFVLAAYLSYKAGVPPDQIGMRALAFGVAGYMLAWACSVTIWRHLVLAELRAAVESGRATIGAPAGAAGTGGGSGRAQATTPATDAAGDDDEGGAGDGE